MVKKTACDGIQACLHITGINALHTANVETKQSGMSLLDHCDC